MHKADTPSPLLSLWLQVIKGTVNIQVGDVNDNAPQFHNQPYSVRIPEVGIAAASPGSPAVGSSLGGYACCPGATAELSARLPEGPPKYGTVLLPWALAVAGGEDQTSGSYCCLKTGRSKEMLLRVLGEDRWRRRRFGAQNLCSLGEVSSRDKCEVWK